MVRENIMLDGDEMHIIDFDDGGWGYRLFDVATALLKNRTEATYPELQRALISGYHSQRLLDVEDLDLFMALRALTYVGWIVDRMDEDGAIARNQRYIAEAKELCETCMENS